MQEELSQLTRELQKETCPQRVHDEVHRRISSRTSSPGRWRLIMGMAAAGLVLASGVSIWRWQAERNTRREAELAAARDRARVAHQAESALGLIGTVLADAGVHSGIVIYDRAVPPLRNSLQTANNKIIHDIQL